MKKIIILILSIVGLIFKSYAQVESSKSENVNYNKIIDEKPIVVNTYPDTTLLLYKRALSTGNNNCTSPTLLTVGNACISYSNSANSFIGNDPTACLSNGNRTGFCAYDQWFIFKATATNNFVSITGTVGSCVGGIAIYGPYATSTPGCPVAANLLYCNTFQLAINDFSSLVYTVGDYYLIQVWDYNCSGCTGGNWCISVKNTVSCSTCSSPCGPIGVYNSTTIPSSWSVESPKYALEPVVPANTLSSIYCFTVDANNVTDQVNMGSATEGIGGYSVFNWTLYASNCSTVASSGTISNLNASGVKCDTGYILCIQFKNSAIVDSISPYMYNATSSCTPLPIQLINFGATYMIDINSVYLYWSTATETNNKLFTIEKSTDGENWISVKNIDGSGNTTTTHYYECYDYNPFSGVSYYRLKQTDYDGNYTYSQIIPINLPTINSINLYPNPTTGNITLKYSSQNLDKIKISIIDITGNYLYENEFSINKGINEFVLPVSEYSSGMYFLNIVNSNNSVYEKFIKN